MRSARVNRQRALLISQPHKLILSLLRQRSRIRRIRRPSKRPNRNPNRILQKPESSRRRFLFDILRSSGFGVSCRRGSGSPCRRVRN